MFNIPLIDDNRSFDCCGRLYRRAIWNILRELSPVYCLEIGTYIYQTSRVFSQYFTQYNPEGLLVTADISVWNRSAAPPDHVYPVMVYPHIREIEREHGGINLYYNDHRERMDNKEDSVKINLYILACKMNDINVDFFDLTFVDGDHTKASFIKDLQLAQILTSPEGYILVDDIKDQGHEQYKVYQELRTHNNFYEFDDWEINPGLALIQNMELSLDNI